MENASHSKYSCMTRLAHMGLAPAIIIQLLTSLVLVPDGPKETANLYFEIHEYSGLTAFAFALFFWIVLIFRKTGTAPGALFPWTSKTRLAALWDNTTRTLGALAKFRLPDVPETSPLASAVHGLGLLLMLAMATSGTVYYVVNNGDPDAGRLVGIVMFVHKTLANLVWAYLIGHAGMATIHHFTRQLRLSEMWNLRE